MFGKLVDLLVRGFVDEMSLLRCGLQSSERVEVRSEGIHDSARCKHEKVIEGSRFDAVRVVTSTLVTIVNVLGFQAQMKCPRE